MSDLQNGNKTPLDLGGFILRFMEYASDAHDKDFPPLDSGPWHEFLWALKKKLKGALPFDAGRFDWDGRYPRNKQLSEFMATLPVVCGSNRDTGRIQLNILIGKAYLDHDYPVLAEVAYEIAKSTEGFFENKPDET